ncbi:MAG: PHP domain-containing protein [Lachnoclostridium sp.]|nr:PHP domain-containing protein [Lachnoclostridium sp.]
MKYIDLHVHSCYSDGTMTPAELVEHAIKNNLAAIALTDHDTIEGVPEIMEAAKGKDIHVIPGVELSVDYEGTEIHILGYGIDYQNPDLNETLMKVADIRDKRNEKMCALLQKGGYPITYEELLDECGENVITRAHFAHFLIRKKAVASIEEAFKGPLNVKSPYYVVREYLSPSEAISLIKENGGIAVLAHPLLYKFSVSKLHKMCDTLRSFGLEGIEVMYSTNKGNDEAFVNKLAKEHDLRITGGSDFHGSNKPHIKIGNGMGSLFVPDTVLDSLQ